AVPGEFTLSQNYPNPFNPTTTINYTLSKADHVTLTIFNMLGQKVKVLVNEQQATGLHRAEWDGTNEAGNIMSSGIYYYQLKNSSTCITKKMVLMK
ncbi:MAG TPA: T9SS type A sorting domain-containing protein, partial [Calditrichaeota bacterium]|nr:T9SS type A sorting domain-containing protein [Calditrichota bacterium]